jgi:Pretoxin HINT domain
VRNLPKWIGKIGCEIAVALFSGGVGASTRIGKLFQRIDDIKAWVKNKLHLPGGRKPGDHTPDPNAPGIHCKLNSFPTGTLVLMANGVRQPIEAISPGDRVVTYDTGTHQWRSQPVLDQWSAVDYGRLATATMGDGSTITATDDHKLWVDNRRSWVQLDQLNPGDHLLSPNGVAAVAEISLSPVGPTLVWELDVAVDDDFLVVAPVGAGVLVHNAVPCRVTLADLGELVGEGGNKKVYAYGEGKVIGILKDGKPLSALEKEIGYLHDLEKLGLPTVKGEIIDVGGKPGIIYDRYALGSKDLVKTVNGRPTIVGDSPLLNAASAADLKAIRQTLVSGKTKIDDLQFLIGKDGHVVIADPLGVFPGQAPSRANLQTIDRLIELAER